MATVTSLRRRQAQPVAVRRAVLRLQRGVQRLLKAELRAYTGGDTPALERYQRAEACHWLGIRFMPRCLSRTASAAAGAAAVLGGLLVVRVAS